MNWKILGLIFALMLIPTASAQSTAPTTGPDSDVTITCDSDYYAPDIHGYIDIYCDILNTGGSTKNEKVGAVFDDWKDTEEVKFIEVETKAQGEAEYTSIKKNLDKSKPIGTKGEQRTKQLSQQNIQTQAGTTTQVHFRIQVPFGSSGKFDIEFGEYKLDPWWNATWGYRKQINLTVDDGSTLNDFQLKMYIDKEDNMTSDYRDIRFLNNCSNDSYEIPYFMESNQTNFTVMWVKVPVINGSICMYWGNENATTTSNGSAVFELFEDFDNTDPVTWTELDPNNQINIDRATDERLEWTSWQSRWVDSWVQTNFSFDDFEADGTIIEIDFTETQNSNAIYSVASWHNLYNDALATNNRTGIVNPGFFRIQSGGRYNNGNINAPVYNTVGSTTYYLRLEETPTIRNLIIYNEIERINVLGYSNYTYSSNRPENMQYFYAISSYTDSQSGVTSGGYLDNIKVSKNYNPYPNYFPQSTEMYDITIPAPNIDFVSPTPDNGTIVTQDSIKINVSNDDYNYHTCILDWNGVNESVNGSGKYCIFNKTSLSEQDYTFKVYANATGGSELNSTEERTVTVVLTGPDITITEPTGSYTLAVGDSAYNVPLTHSITDDLLDSCWYNVGSGNVTLSTCENTTLSLGEGSYNLSLYANNTGGFESVETSSFTVSSPPLNNIPAPFGGVAAVAVAAGFILLMVGLYFESGIDTRFFITGTIGLVIVIAVIGFLLTGS